MDLTDASPFDVEAAIGDIRHGILRSIILGLLGMAVAIGGYAYDHAGDTTATVDSARNSSPA